jgi:type II secretory pathway pseudopilin PulG
MLTSRHAFTVIELLVVAATIVIRAAILFPVFAQARAKAHQASCASNLGQIARAGMMYVQDNDDRFPSCYSASGPPYVMDPRTSLRPYVKNWDVFYCPDRQTVLPECLDPAADYRRNERYRPGSSQ